MRLPTIGLVVGKKKVWSRLVYLDGGSGIPMLQINIPHTRIVEYGIEHPNNHTIRSDECDASLVALKIFQISIQGQKLIHFHQQNMSSPKGDLTKVWFFVKNAKSQCKVTRVKSRKGIQNSKFKIQNFGVPSARVLKKIPKKRKDDHKHLEAPLKYTSPTIGEAGRGGRNCARRPRRAARRAGASVPSPKLGEGAVRRERSVGPTAGTNRPLWHSVPSPLT